MLHNNNWRWGPALRRWWELPSWLGLCAILCVLALVATIALTAHCEPMLPDDGADLDAAILSLLAEVPGHPLMRSAAARSELAAAISVSAARHELPPTLLLAMAFLESSLRATAIGPLGERGVLQVHGAAAHACDLDTVAGQVECGARWLRVAWDRCGSARGAVAAYATGSCDIERVDLLVSRRLALWLRLGGQE